MNFKKRVLRKNYCIRETYNYFQSQDSMMSFFALSLKSTMNETAVRQQKTTYSTPNMQIM